MTSAFERVARVGGLLSLLVALALTLWPRDASRSVQAAPIEIGPAQYDSASAVARGIAAHLIDGSLITEVSRDSAGSALTVRLSAIPDAATRATLSAAAASGIAMAWTDATGIGDFATDAASAPSPQPNSLLMATVRSFTTNADTSTSALVLRDDGGVLDSLGGVHKAEKTLRVRAARLRPPVRATALHGSTRTVNTRFDIPSPLLVRRVLLYARPGWEAKFTAAALEESGWAVDGSLVVSPTSRVRLGSPMTVDTARYSAAIVLDSGVADVRALRRFVAQGGGVILSGESLRDVALTTLMAARIDDDRAPIAGALLTERPRLGLSAFHLSHGTSSVVIEREGDAPTVVVSRRGVGRVLASGYRSTWRWRMEGTDDGANDHRRWWTGLVSSVAFAIDTTSVRRTLASRLPGDAAPRADLLARLGPAMAPASLSASSASVARPPIWWFYLLGAVLLMIEWTARRVRGAP